MDIYEVFWDARPSLKAINAKVGGGDLSADVQTLFEAVRAVVNESLPGAVALTRITTQSKTPEEPLPHEAQWQGDVRRRDLRGGGISEARHR